MWEIMLPFLGFLIGTVAALTGIGGGVFIVPLLTLLYAFSPANAAGTSLTVIVFTALAATLNYSKQKRISYRTGALLAVVRPTLEAVSPMSNLMESCLALCRKCYLERF